MPRALPCHAGAPCAVCCAVTDDAIILIKLLPLTLMLRLMRHADFALSPICYVAATLTLPFTVMRRRCLLARYSVYATRAMSPLFADAYATAMLFSISMFTFHCCCCDMALLPRHADITPCSFFAAFDCAMPCCFMMRYGATAICRMLCVAAFAAMPTFLLLLRRYATFST